METIRGQEEFLSTQAQDLMDTAAKSEVAVKKLLDQEMNEDFGMGEDGRYDCTCFLGIPGRIPTDILFWLESQLNDFRRDLLLHPYVASII